MSMSYEQARKMARAAIFGNYITYTGILHRKMDEVEGDVVAALRDAYRAGLEDAAKGAELFLATDKYAAKENIPRIIRALPIEGGETPAVEGICAKPGCRALPMRGVKHCRHHGGYEEQPERLGQGEADG